MLSREFKTLKLNNLNVKGRLWQEANMSELHAWSEIGFPPQLKRTLNTTLSSNELIQLKILCYQDFC